MDTHACVHAYAISPEGPESSDGWEGAAECLHLSVKVLAVVGLVQQLQQQYLHLISLQACGQGEAQCPVQEALECQRTNGTSVYSL